MTNCLFDDEVQHRLRRLHVGLQPRELFTWCRDSAHYHALVSLHRNMAGFSAAVQMEQDDAWRARLWLTLLQDYSEGVEQVLSATGSCETRLRYCLMQGERYAGAVVYHLLGDILAMLEPSCCFYDKPMKNAAYPKRG